MAIVVEVAWQVRSALQVMVDPAFLEQLIGPVARMHSLQRVSGSIIFPIKLWTEQDISNR